MSIIKEGAIATGKFLAPGAAKIIERYGPKPDEGSRLGLLSKDILRAAFPGAYAITDRLKLTGGKRKPKKRDKQSAVTESVSELSNEVVETNSILSTSIEIQTQQNIILTEILKALKEGGGAGGKDGPDIPGVPRVGRGPKGGRGPRGVKGKNEKGPKGARKPRGGPKDKIFKTREEARRAGGGRYYDKSGKLQELTKNANGKFVSRYTKPTAVPETKPSLLGKGASVAGGFASRALGVLAIAGLAYDIHNITKEGLEEKMNQPDSLNEPGGFNKWVKSLFGGGDDEKKDKKEQKFDTQYITYNAEDISFKSNSMSIKAREFTIKGDIDGLNLGSGGSEPGMLPGVAKGDAADRQRAVDDISSKLRRSRPGTGNLEGFNIQSGIDTRVEQGIVDKLKGLQPSIPGMIITSGYRDPARNAAAGGASGSQHLQGNAVDIHFPGGVEETIKVIEAASKAGIGGIGVYGPGRLHLDTGSTRAWGPTYKIESVPEWALEAIQKHTGMKGYADGTNNVPQTGPAVVGEKGSELVVGKNGVSITPDTSTIMSLNQGDAVIPNNAFAPIKFGREGLMQEASHNPTLKGGLEHVGEKNIIAKKGAIKEAGGGLLAGAYYPKGFMGSKEAKIVYDESRGYEQSRQTLNHELRHAASGRMYTERLMNRDMGFVQGMIDKGYIDPKTGTPMPENPWQGVGEEARNRLTDLTTNRLSTQTGTEAAYDVRHMDKYINQGLDMNIDSPSERRSVRERRRGQLEEANRELDTYYSTKMLGAMFGSAN